MRPILPLLVASLLVLTAAPAIGAEEAPKPVDDTIKLSPVGLPIIVDGRVVNYVFVTVVVDLTASADALTLREKEPDFRDALVRDAHRTPFVIPGDYNHLDVVKLKAAFYKDVAAMIGARSIKGIEVQNQQAQHFIRPPRPQPPVSN